MSDEYQGKWEGMQARRAAEDVARAAELEERRKWDARVASARAVAEAAGITVADVDRWAAENRALVTKRWLEDQAWGITLSRRAADDRARQEAWVAANPEASVALAEMAR